VQTKQTEDMVNLLFTFASNKPKDFGVYRLHTQDDVDELIAHYEPDLIENVFLLDAEHLTRLCQTLYLLKTREF
jgi:hypothetical protein